jgi:ubiquinone/menaquinone biosynthesis C-methylase UbiE
MMKKNLMIKWYDKLTDGVRSDIDVYLQEAMNAKQPILELAVGTGRILIELLENGIEAHGLDLSEEMLDICRKKLSEKGLSTELHQMNMAELDIPEKNYGMIFCSRATLQMLESRRELNSCLSKVYDHLNEDGLFVADMFIPWQGIIENQQKTVDTWSGSP